MPGPVSVFNTTPDNIQNLGPNEIFVFGSNLRGIHGKGAALTARERFGAELGIGMGRTGQCYAIPTKDAKLHSLPRHVIKVNVDHFLKHTIQNPAICFLVTRIGCGPAGHREEDIAPMFKDAPPNVFLPKEFHAVLHSSC